MENGVLISKMKTVFLYHSYFLRNSKIKKNLYEDLSFCPLKSKTIQIKIWTDQAIQEYARVNLKANKTEIKSFIRSYKN